MRPVLSTTVSGILAVTTLLGGATVAQEEDAELRQQIEELKKGQEAIQKDIADIKRLLQGLAARPAASAPTAPDVRNLVVDVGSNPYRGSATAPLTLVEFTDYQCPYCSRHVRETSPLIESEFVETGRVRLIKMDLPLPNHKDAFRAAVATHCAEDQGKFWEMHDRLFANQRAIEPLKGHAEALGLDGAVFESCMASEKQAEAVRKDMSAAQKAGATGTPTFILGSSDPADPTKVKGIALLRGAQQFAAFKAEIEKALASEK